MSYSFHFFSLPGERAISKTIMKVRRKGQVREVRTDEGHKYGGEETGIKSGLSRSRKLGTR